VLLWALSFAPACGDSSTSTPGPDLAVSNMDMAVGHDLATGMPAADSCAALLICGSMCTTANIGTCGPACLAKASTTAQGYFGALQACVKAMCNNADGGTTDCSDAASAACATCTENKCASPIVACQAH
jgi:hypothetical protein